MTVGPRHRQAITENKMKQNYPEVGTTPFLTIPVWAVVSEPPWESRLGVSLGSTVPGPPILTLSASVAMGKQLTLFGPQLSHL